MIQSSLGRAVFLSLLLVGAAFAARPAAAETPQYYCEPARAFYPAVATCSAPWKEIDRRAGSVNNVSLTALPVLQPAMTQNASATAPKSSAPVRAEPITAPEHRLSASIALMQFGPQQMPILCAQKQVCDITLQQGEQIKSVKLGEADKWSVDQLVEGSAPRETHHLVISPSETGLDTSMIVITSLRAYHLRLQSGPSEYMAQISFSYPEENEAAPAKAEPVALVAPETLLPQSEANGNLVTIGGIAYVKGREPHMLGSGKEAVPPQSLANLTPPAEASAAPPKPAPQATVPAASAGASGEPPAPAAAPRPRVEVLE